MTEVIILWDKPILLENLFKEYEISCRIVIPDALSAPHIGTAKMILLPAGFSSEYADSGFKTKLFKEKCVNKLIAFAENGGKLLIFSPLQDFDFSWLNLPIKYKREDIMVSAVSKTQTDAEQNLTAKQNPIAEPNPAAEQKTDPICLINQDDFFCDGFFEIPAPENSKIQISIIETDHLNRPIHLSIPAGKGEIILSSIHEFLSKEYFDSLLVHQNVKI
ncbi:hypothetical protein MsAg5_03370 [Methanosarcinaceae archaeon Ag5]|uniref:Uncharacterized protein n=1 Tax=Methanolapillus africanus TaxID=3028297 RepID=A0AAE4SDE7_9EURY|nr:hypothetical protein [Methanosarcinaceae archaeon Ag5]